MNSQTRPSPDNVLATKKLSAGLSSRCRILSGWLTSDFMNSPFLPRDKSRGTSPSGKKASVSRSHLVCARLCRSPWPPGSDSSQKYEHEKIPRSPPTVSLADGRLTEDEGGKARKISTLTRYASGARALPAHWCGILG